MVRGGRRRLAEGLAAERIPDEPERLDGFAQAIGRRLEERGIVGRVPGVRTKAEEEHAAYRERVRAVFDALRAPEPPAPEPEPEVRQSLPDQLRTLIGGQHTTAMPLNTDALIRYAVEELGPGSSAAGGQPAGGSA